MTIPPAAIRYNPIETQFFTGGTPELARITAGAVAAPSNTSISGDTQGVASGRACPSSEKPRRDRDACVSHHDGLRSYAKSRLTGGSLFFFFFTSKGFYSGTAVLDYR